MGINDVNFLVISIVILKSFLNIAEVLECRDLDGHVIKFSNNK